MDIDLPMDDHAAEIVTDAYVSEQLDAVRTATSKSMADVELDFEVRQMLEII